ncbi:MAG: CPBP family intramembrane metalloprotease [Anaerolineae bacterium]|nr:CPBP family intramembrane metalloprotease [Anaerolineae bacterium]
MQDSKRKRIIWYVVIFSLLVTGIAWISPLLGGSPDSPGLGLLVWGMAPLLVSLLMRAVTKDWSDVGIHPAIKKNALGYGISLLAYPVTMLLAMLVGNLISVSSLHEFSLGGFLQTALIALPVFFILAIFEEVGWRGYLAPKLASLSINRYLASALVAVVWASWHLPYIRELTWDYTSEGLMTFIPRFYLVSFAFSIVYGEVRDMTGTFWSAVLMHAVGNSFGHPLAAEYIKIAAGKEYLGSISNGLLEVAFMIVLGIALIQWRTRQTRFSQAAA